MMKRLLFLLLCSAAFAQGVRYDLPPILNSRGQPIANAQITLCTGTASISGSNCSGTAQSFTDITLTTQCPSGLPVTLPNSNVCQATGDALGNAGFWLSPGAYIYCVNVPGTTGKCYNLTVPIGATAAGNGTLGTNSLTAGAGTFGSLIQCKNLEQIRCIDTANSAGWAGSDVGGWINSAIADLAGQNGGKIIVAGGSYTFSTVINANNTNNIQIIGAASNNGGALGGTNLTYTGTTSPITAKASLGLKLLNMQIAWNNASFAGSTVDFSGAEADIGEVAYCTFGATGSGANAPIIINLDKATRINVHDNSFYNYVVAVQGPPTSSSFSNAIQINHNNFSSSTGTAVTAHIRNPGQAWKIMRNTFEMGTGAGTPAVIGFTGGVTSLGVSLDTNWIGDAGTGTWTFITTAGSGWSITSNYIGGNANTTAISISSTNSVHIKGNVFATHSVGISFTGTNQAQDIGANNCSSVTTATSGNPSSGQVFDCNSLINTETSEHDFTAFSAYVETSAPSGASNKDVCYGDSTAHATKCSYNNGTFGQVLLDNATQTLTNKAVISPIISTGISQGSGFKHQRASTGSITNGTRGSVTLNWTSAFADANYTVACSLNDSTTGSTSAGLVLERINNGPVAGSVSVTILNNAGSPVTGTLDCIAVHD